MAQQRKRRTVPKEKSTTRSKTHKPADSGRDDHAIYTIHPHKDGSGQWVFVDPENGVIRPEPLVDR